MKAILVVGTIGMLTAPAVAGNKKPQTKSVRLATKAEVAKPVEQKPAEVAPAKLESEALDIPVLAPDTYSPLAPIAGLDRAPAPVVPAKPMMKGKEKAPVLKMGKDYVLGGRQSAKPGAEVEQFIPRSLNQAQVATVVQAHMSDIQNCWDLVPKAQRANACTAQLRLTISDAGAVTDIELGGDVPAGAHRCMTSAIARWQFPVAEQKSEVEYGISLRSL